MFFFEDDFKIWSEGKIYGNWFVNFNGFGSIGVEPTLESTQNTKMALFLKPKASLGSWEDETHGCLITSTKDMGDFNCYLRLKTIKQLRKPSPENWETAWIIWHWTDAEHFYYFTLKKGQKDNKNQPTGWELGKTNPKYKTDKNKNGQHFLAVGESPKMQLGSFQGVQINQTGKNIKIVVDGKKIISLTDNEEPYLSGKLGLYCEDAYVQFTDVSVSFEGKL